MCHCCQSSKPLVLRGILNNSWHRILVHVEQSETWLKSEIFSFNDKILVSISIILCFFLVYQARVMVILLWNIVSIEIDRYHDLHVAGPFKLAT